MDNQYKDYLEYYKKREKQSERIKEALVKQTGILNKEDYAYLVGLLGEDIENSKEQIEYYTWLLEKESDE